METICTRCTRKIYESDYTSDGGTPLLNPFPERCDECRKQASPDGTGIVDDCRYVAMLETAVRIGWPNKFQTDLLWHDCQSIAAGYIPSGESFLWGVRESGTQLVKVTNECSSASVKSFQECWRGTRWFLWEHGTAPSGRRGGMREVSYDDALAFASAQEAPSRIRRAESITYDRDHLAAVSQFADTIGKLDQLREQLERIETIAHNYEGALKVSRDSDRSFYFAIRRNGSVCLNGGVIFHGDDSSGEWSIHT